MNNLDRIRNKIDQKSYFELDLSDEKFRQSALLKYAPEWASRKPFYARRFGIPSVVITRAKDFREVMMDSERFVMRVPDLPGYDAFDIFGGLESVLQMDGERHSRIRRLMAPAFAASNLENIKPSIEKIVKQRLDLIEKNGPYFDASTDFCDHLIMRSLLDATFALSDEQQVIFQNAHKVMFSPNFKPGEARPSSYTNAMNKVRGVIDDVITERRNNPKSDFISKLVSARDQGQKLSEEELYGQINTICAAALGSTSASLAIALYVLLSHRDQFDLLKNNMGYLDSAIDECLRFHCPGMFVFPRFSVLDTTVSGTAIYKDMLIIASPQTANFDGDEFINPEKFDIRRKAQNYTFGTGNHHCIGFRLAKTTMKIAIKALIARFPDLRLKDASYKPVYRGNVGSLFLTELPLSIK